MDAIGYERDADLVDYPALGGEDAIAALANSRARRAIARWCSCGLAVERGVTGPAARIAFDTWEFVR